MGAFAVLKAFTSVLIDLAVFIAEVGTVDTSPLVTEMTDFVSGLLLLLLIHPKVSDVVDVNIPVCASDLRTFGTGLSRVNHAAEVACLWDRCFPIFHEIWAGTAVVRLPVLIRGQRENNRGFLFGFLLRTLALSGRRCSRNRLTGFVKRLLEIVVGS